MFQKYSNGYYLKSYWIEKNTDSKNKINQYEYDKIKKLYNNSPIIMKIGPIHFEIKGNENVSFNTIELSSSIISNLQLKRLPKYHPVLITKPKYIKQIIKLNSPNIKSGINNI